MLLLLLLLLLLWLHIRVHVVVAVAVVSQVVGDVDLGVVNEIRINLIMLRLE